MMPAPPPALQGPARSATRARRRTCRPSWLPMVHRTWQRLPSLIPPTSRRKWRRRSIPRDPVTSRSMPPAAPDGDLKAKQTIAIGKLAIETGLWVTLRDGGRDGHQGEKGGAKAGGGIPQRARSGSATSSNPSGTMQRSPRSRLLLTGMPRNLALISN